MPPQKRTTPKAKDSVTVEPSTAAKPRSSSTSPSKAEIDSAIEQSAEFIQQQSEPPTDVHPKATTPSKAEIDAAVEQSADFLAQQEAAPTDVHPKATTPSKAEVEAAVEQSAEFLTSQGVTTEARSVDSAPVSAGGTDARLAAAPVSAGSADSVQAASPVYGGRDKTMDASPTFSAPVPNSPSE